MSNYQVTDFSKWFLQLCNSQDIPISIASGASAMMAGLPQWHWGKSRCYLSCIACIRISYKWVDDIINYDQLSALDVWTGKKLPICWFDEELSILRDINWNIRHFFEPIPRPMVKVASKPRAIETVEQFLLSNRSKPKH